MPPAPAPAPTPAADRAAQAEHLAAAPLSLPRADGTVFPIAQETVQLMLPADILPGVRGSDPMPVGIMVFSDLTPLLRLQHEACLAGILRVMNSAAAEVAHKMRNPLSAISGAIQVINSLEEAVAHGGRPSPAACRGRSEFVQPFLPVQRSDVVRNGQRRIKHIENLIFNLLDVRDAWQVLTEWKRKRTRLDTASGSG